MRSSDRVAALEQALAAVDPAAVRQTRATRWPTDDQFWLLREVRDRHPDGAVMFGGTATLPAGEVAGSGACRRTRSWNRTGNRQRVCSTPCPIPSGCSSLQRVLNGTTSTAELAEDESLGTTGQLHHHLRALVAAGLADLHRPGPVERPGAAGHPAAGDDRRGHHEMRRTT